MAPYLIVVDTASKKKKTLVSGSSGSLFQTALSMLHSRPLVTSKHGSPLAKTSPVGSLPKIATILGPLGKDPFGVSTRAANIRGHKVFSTLPWPSKQVLAARHRRVRRKAAPNRFAFHQGLISLLSKRNTTTTRHKKTNTTDPKKRTFNTTDTTKRQSNGPRKPVRQDKPPKNFWISISSPTSPRSYSKVVRHCRRDAKWCQRNHPGLYKYYKKYKRYPTYRERVAAGRKGTGAAIRGKSTYLLIGCIAGGLLLIGGVVLIYLCCCRDNKKNGSNQSVNPRGKGSSKKPQSSRGKSTKTGKSKKSSKAPKSKTGLKSKLKSKAK